MLIYVALVTIFFAVIIGSVSIYGMLQPMSVEERRELSPAINSGFLAAIFLLILSYIIKKW